MSKLDTDNNKISENVWKQYSADIRKLCRIKFIDMPAVAEDVFSEVFLAYIKAVNSGIVIKNAKAWLYKVANNLICKKQKELQKQRSSAFSADNVISHSHQLAVYPDLAELMISDELIENIADDIIGALSEEENLLLECFLHKNMHWKEIAELTGKTEGAVKQKYYRLCIKIRKSIKDYINSL